MEQSNCPDWIQKMVENVQSNRFVTIPSDIRLMEYKPVIHAHWVDEVCSHCNQSFTDCVDAVYIYYNPPYCPECGTIMDEGL